ncbi:radical SAM family heme chaperone HemW [Maribacter sp. 2-571]|uniref:radical SAM family heme chaperone HemW n=1 Tax=Maribacter sp. 2-571 TaxID=3417569 RepID=UPI003D356526
MSGIYIHIPFCKQACHYCDFHFSTVLGKKEAMVAALREELRLRKEEFKEELVETIYFGGGTPSVLSMAEIDAIIASVYEHYRVSEAPEITLEANPDDLTSEKVAELAASPINRLSIGVQSFHEKDLKLMNRAHDAKEAISCIEEALRYFDNISIDLIYGIPGMDERQWRENIERALSFQVPHISSYALTVEPKTPLANFVKKGLVTVVDDAVVQQHFLLLAEMLEEAGYDNYEISNFGKPGYFSKNNTAYWQQKKYIGIGPSAHSYDGTRRGWNVNNNPKYIRAIADGMVPMEVETLSTTDKYNEYIMTGLRTIWGVSMNQISAEYGVKYADYALDRAEKYIEDHLLYLDGDTLRATRKGLFLADGMAADLFMVNLG